MGCADVAARKKDIGNTLQSNRLGKATEIQTG